MNVFLGGGKCLIREASLGEISKMKRKRYHILLFNYGTLVHRHELFFSIYTHFIITSVPLSGFSLTSSTVLGSLSLVHPEITIKQFFIN